MMSLMILLVYQNKFLKGVTVKVFVKIDVNVRGMKGGPENAHESPADLVNAFLTLRRKISNFLHAIKNFLIIFPLLHHHLHLQLQVLI